MNSIRKWQDFEINPITPHNNDIANFTKNVLQVQKLRKNKENGSNNIKFNLYLLISLIHVWKNNISQ